MCHFDIRKPKGKSTDPRHARSLDLEIMEEEAEELTKELEEERAKNKYLTALVEDLKRCANLWLCSNRQIL